MTAARIVKPLVAMQKPPASFSDHGWRAIAMCGTRWMVAARYEDAVTVENGVVVKTWDAAAHAKLFATAPELLSSLKRAVDHAFHAYECSWWDASAEAIAAPTRLSMAEARCNCWKKDAVSVIAKATGSTS